MKKSKKLKGFTLIEMIVVIAIIGALAAIIIPSMLGYVRRSKASSLEANAKNAYSGAALAVLRLNIDDQVFEAGEIYTGQDDGNAQCSSGGSIDISEYLGEDFSGCYGFKVASDGLSVECAVWSETPVSEQEVKIYTHDEVLASISSKGVGSYPVIAT